MHCSFIILKYGFDVLILTFTFLKKTFLNFYSVENRHSLYLVTANITDLFLSVLLFFLPSFLLFFLFTFASCFPSIIFFFLYFPLNLFPICFTHLCLFICICICIFLYFIVCFLLFTCRSFYASLSTSVLPLVYPFFYCCQVSSYLPFF